MQSLWMLVSALLFALMAACVKLAATQYGTAEIVLFRSLVGVVGLFAYARVAGQPLSTGVAAMHLRRSALGVLALALWFYAIGALPLGTAMTLNFSSPLFSTAFVIAAAFAGGRRVPWILAACIGAGFLGVVLILRPSFGTGQEVPALVGLLSGFLSAAAYWHVRELGRIGEPEWRTVFYFSLCGSVLGLIGSVPKGLTRHHTPAGLVTLVAVGVCATLAQLAMTRAYGRGRTVLTANLQFSAIVFAALLGMALFGDDIGHAGWLGVGIIIASCVIATALVARRRAAPVLEATIATANK
ncbi:MAG TPA: DMT family transporter [Burkholderiaceae bacterium]|nr:DMT family transporter [Burkholderiaceae bacterium]